MRSLKVANQQQMKKIYISLFLVVSYAGAFAQKNDRIPRAERPIERLDLSVNRVPYVHAQYPQLKGQGLAVSLKEFRFDSDDLDLLGKEISSSSSAQLESTHATNMATIIGGLGNSDYTGRGVAPGISISSTSFFNIAPEPIDYYRQHGISVQNHSYGIGIENFYGSEARAYDSLTCALPYLVHVFSAGNLGDSSSTEGSYAGIPGFANLTGTFKQAKNVLTVGAVDPNLQVEPQSSRGPAYDGRIKPELVAYGEDGSSGAAAITAGVAVLLQQAFAQKNQDQLPPAALIRSILINTADDLQQPGPDYSSGFGNLNARRALDLINRKQYVLDSITRGDSLVFSINIPQGIHRFDATLAWTDPPGSALVNDLDLWIEDEHGQRYRPWTLDPAAQTDRLRAPATQAVDRLNPQEKVSILQPAAGRYTMHLSNRGAIQPFALSYYQQTDDALFLVAPSGEQPLLPDSTQLIRWDWTGAAQNARLEYKYTDGQSWQTISSALPLARGQYAWKTPHRPGSLYLRLVLADSSYLSDTLLISPAPAPEILSDCTNNLILSWKAIANLEQYQVFQLRDHRMVSIAIVTDTFFLATEPTVRPVFAVVPILPSGKRGRRSLALEASLQQSPCYVANFTARREGTQGRIDLNLSTNYNITALQLQKWDGTQFITLTNWSIDALDHHFLDPNIQLSNNFYRVRIDLSNEEVLFTNTQNIFYVPEDAVLLYPNPVMAGQELRLSIPTFQNRTIYIYDARGRLLLREEIGSPLHRIDTQNLTAGLYFYTITGAATQLEHKGKIIIK